MSELPARTSRTTIDAAAQSGGTCQQRCRSAANITCDVKKQRQRMAKLTRTMATDTSTKKTCTAILCELTRLKTQQKYLECSQVKLNPDHFEETMTMTVASPTTSPHPVVSLINEIENSKIQMEAELNNYRGDLQREVRDMWVFVDAIKEDVSQPERLRQFSVNAIRERVIGINTQLERLRAKNEKDLKRLQTDYEQLEGETKFQFKFAT